MDVTRGVFGVVLIFGAVVILLTLLNRRDRRASRLRHIVLDQLALPELRGRVGVHIQYAVFSWRRAVIVDLLAGTPHEVWNVFTRLASRLPPRVRLVVYSTPIQGSRGHSASRSAPEACPLTRPARRSSTSDVAPVYRG
jgi:hypothetical protein